MYKMNLHRIALYLSWQFPPYFSSKYDKLLLIEKLQKFCGIETDNLFKVVESEQFYYMALHKAEINWWNWLQELVADLEIPSDVVWNIIIKEVVKDIVKPLILTEWKTDSMLLKTAWLVLNGITDFNVLNYSQLFDNKCSYKIEWCDLYEWEKIPITNWSAEILSQILTFWQWNTILIWLFDRDDAWNEWFWKVDKMNNNGLNTFQYFNDKDNQNQYKFKLKNGKHYVFGMLYPIPLNRNGYEVRDNKKGDWAIEIEYYFRDSDILSLWFWNCIKSSENDWFKYTSLSINKKDAFASKVIEEHNKIDFSDFKVLFDKLDEILKNRYIWV